MTSSDSINYSKYSIINEQNSSRSTDLEIIDPNDTNQKTKQTELSNILISEEENNKKELNKNDISLPISEKQELPQPMEQPAQTSVHNLLFGNAVDTLNPKFLGKSYAFSYDEYGDPKITIGPDCKFNMLLL
jgi:hypothetical protein